MIEEFELGYLNILYIYILIKKYIKICIILFKMKKKKFNQSTVLVLKNFPIPLYQLTDFFFLFSKIGRLGLTFLLVSLTSMHDLKFYIILSIWLWVYPSSFFLFLFYLAELKYILTPNFFLIKKKVLCISIF